MPDPLVLTEIQVRRLTGLSRHQIAYWRETGFFAASLSGLYSFRDLVALKTLSTLRNQQRVSLQELRRLGRRLTNGHSAPWSDLRFGVVGGEVVFGDRDSQELANATGQSALPFDLPELVEDLRRAVAGLAPRRPEDAGRVERRRRLLGGESRLTGTRIPTGAIARLRAAGYDVEAIAREYPRVHSADVDALTRRLNT